MNEAMATKKQLDNIIDLCKALGYDPENFDLKNLSWIGAINLIGNLREEIEEE